MPSFITFLAVVALPLCSFLLGAWIMGLRDVPNDSAERPTRASQVWTLARLLVVIIGTAFILVDPPVIAALPLQYGLLIALPVALGLVARAAFGRYLAAQG